MYWAWEGVCLWFWGCLPLVQGYMSASGPGSCVCLPLVPGDVHPPGETPHPLGRLPTPWADTPPWVDSPVPVNRITDRSKNRTFRQLMLRTVIKGSDSRQLIDIATTGDYISVFMRGFLKMHLEKLLLEIISAYFTEIWSLWRYRLLYIKRNIPQNQMVWG